MFQTGRLWGSSRECCEVEDVRVQRQPSDLARSQCLSMDGASACKAMGRRRAGAGRRVDRDSIAAPTDDPAHQGDARMGA